MFIKLYTELYIDLYIELYIEVSAAGPRLDVEPSEHHIVLYSAVLHSTSI